MFVPRLMLMLARPTIANSFDYSSRWVLDTMLVAGMQSRYYIILKDHAQSSQVVATLLSLGCNANTIPSDLYEDMMRTPEDVVAKEVQPEMPWCTPSLRVELARR